MKSMMIMPPTPVAPEVLAGFSTFQQLDANTLARAACRTQVHRAPPHTCLLAQGTSDDWNLYLVDGKLQLVANDGDMELTESGSQKARAGGVSQTAQVYGDHADAGYLSLGQRRDHRPGTEGENRQPGGKRPAAALVCQT